MQLPLYLLADIGGTNARFALFDGKGEQQAAIRLRTADYDKAEFAVDAALTDLGSPVVTGAYFAWAGPVRNGAASLTNQTGWSLDIATVNAITGTDDVVLVNDFVAQTRAIPLLTGGSGFTIDKRAIIAGQDNPAAPFAVIGPGTGLGIGIMSSRDGAGQTLAGEGGHVTLAARTDEEAALIKIAARQLDHFSAERFVSGGELFRLYEAVAELNGQQVAANLSGETIAQLAQKGDQVAQQTIGHFIDFLGTIASDLAVTCGAGGGVWLTGDLLKQWHSNGMLDDKRLAQRFTDKGRFSDYCAACGLHQNMTNDPAFLGLYSYSMTSSANNPQR